MGLTSHSSRADDSCRSIVVDCTTEEADQTPDTWTCFSRNEFDVFFGSSRLKAVENEAKDPLCSVFQDGTFEEATSVQEAGDASGLRKPE